MPELPELEALCEALSLRTVGHRASRVWLADLAALKTYDPALGELVDATFEGVSRRGKFVCMTFVTSDGELLYLVLHLSRGGWMRWVTKPSGIAPKPGRGPLSLRLTVADSGGGVVGGIDVTEAGTKKRMAIYVVRDLDDVAGIVRLGPDPPASGFTETDLNTVLAESGNRTIKKLLRDQAVIAGIGNAWSDEILHDARLSPNRRQDTRGRRMSRLLK